jgi:hypothetical protein
MVVPVVALRVVISAGVGEERLATCLLDSADYVVDEKWLNVIGVAQFAHVQFDGYEIAFFHAVKSASLVIEAISLLQQVKCGIPRDKMDGHGMALHFKKSLLAYTGIGNFRHVLFVVHCNIWVTSDGYSEPETEKSLAVYAPHVSIRSFESQPLNIR